MNNCVAGPNVAVGRAAAISATPDYSRLAEPALRAERCSLGRQRVRLRAPVNRASLGRCATQRLRARPPPDLDDSDISSVTGPCWSIPLSHDPVAGVFLLSGV